MAGVFERDAVAVITGAASGILKAGHEGAGRDASFGLHIRLPFEQALPTVQQSQHLDVVVEPLFHHRTQHRIQPRTVTAAR